ncbi:uncharacterized protein LOC122625135 [Drosophila teissieri]|uniref:uncharacterized protein LOC122625135 n=1 Tax=Drosophila teissieri TaxID=7243 RepID=UPI001CB9FEB4|nr:uncharacterized protein LOC122625135 [Drosophila teissieri]
MRVRGDCAAQSTSATARQMTQMPLQLLSPKCILLLALLLLLDSSRARPQQFLLAEDLLTGAGAGTDTGTATASGTGFGDDRVPINDPSDLSAGLNLAPVGSLIAAAANAVPPAPVQFIRTAMNSGL